MSKNGFSLIEMLVYLSVFAVAAGMLTTIFTIFIRIQSRESAGAAVMEELSFAQNTIQRLVREASNIENAGGVISNAITLRMASTTKTIISYEDGKIYLQQNDKPEKTSLISDKVRVTQFDVIKYENPGGHAVVQVDLALTYDNPNAFQQITRKLQTSIGRVTAATFDDNLVPGSTVPPNAYSLGSVSQPWQNLYLSGNSYFSGTVFLGNLAADPGGARNGAIYYNTVDNTFRGYQNNAWNIFSMPGGSYFLPGNVGNGVFQYMQVDAETFAAPLAGDCDSDPESGRIVLNYSDNKLYICNFKAGRGWDSLNLSQ